MQEQNEQMDCRLEVARSKRVICPLSLHFELILVDNLNRIIRVLTSPPVWKLWPRNQGALAINIEDGIPKFQFPYFDLPEGSKWSRNCFMN